MFKGRRAPPLSGVTPTPARDRRRARHRPWCFYTKASARQGDGGSDPRPLPWPLDYMERKANDVLPYVLNTRLLMRPVGRTFRRCVHRRTLCRHGQRCVGIGRSADDAAFFVGETCPDAIAEAKRPLEQGACAHGWSVDVASLSTAPDSRLAGSSALRTLWTLSTTVHAEAAKPPAIARRRSPRTTYKASATLRGVR